MYYIILFCSRNNAFRFYDVLQREGIEAFLVNTPKGADMSCGLSVKIFDYNQAKRMLSYGNYPYYRGILKAEDENGRMYYTKIE